MSVELQVALSAHEISVLDTVEARVRVRNTGPLLLAVPGMNDRTPALSFEVVDRATGDVVRRVNGFSHQALLTRARIDPANDLEVLPAGQALDFTLDLAQFHQTLAAGDYEVRATYEHPPAGASATAPSIPLRVVDCPVAHAAALRDDPVLDGLGLLLQDDRGNAWVRLHNHQRPLAAWYNRRLELPAGSTGAFLASSGFFQTESFDPFFDSWVVFEHGAYVVARRLRWGGPTGEQRAALLPGRGRLLRSAYRDRSGGLFVFFQSNGLLEGYRLDASALVKVLEHRLPGGAFDACVRADEHTVHIVYPHRGIVHAKVGLGGQPTTEDRIHRTGLTPVSWIYEPAARRVKAAFLDSPSGRIAELVVADASGVHVERRDLCVRGRITELAFDRGRQGVTHVLFATSRGRLYLTVGDRAPARVASGQARYFPHVIADAPAYLGFAQAGSGYRFRAYTLRQRQPRLIDYEMAAWVKP